MIHNEVRIVDLADKGTKFPRWLVKRSVEIVLNNLDQLTPRELRSVAEVLLREAGSRIVLGEER